jgi:hypothetical protein
VICRAGRDRINLIQQKLLHAVNLISVKGRRPMAFAGTAEGRALMDGNFINICPPMRLDDFLANKDLQELNNVDSVKKEGSKILAVISPNGMIRLSS